MSVPFRLAYLALALATASAFAAELPVLDCGVAAGDVTTSTAVIWTHASVPGTMQVSFGKEAVARIAPRAVSEAGPMHEGPQAALTAERGLCAQVTLAGLEPGTRYAYTVRALSSAGASAPVSGTFATLPAPGRAADVKLVWGADLGGQGHCRQGPDGYAILSAMRDTRPDLALFLGDMIYADSPCPAPPNLPGAEAVCRTRDDFRRRWIYNRSDPNHRALLASTSMVTTWDDHEVENDFGGTAAPLIAEGLAAFLEFHPLAADPADPKRIYRRLRWGNQVELFVLDTRQYRGANSAADGPANTLLGAAQTAWLMGAVKRSDAVWKVIGTSMPLTVPTGSNAEEFGRDGWANGSTGPDERGLPSGREHEATALFTAFRDAGVKNLVWLAADVHFAQGARLDPFRDGSFVCHEFISGPLSAIRSAPPPLDATFNPTVLFAEGDLFNFGELAVDAAARTLTARIRDQKGALRHQLVLPAR